MIGEEYTNTICCERHNIVSIKPTKIFTRKIEIVFDMFLEKCNSVDRLLIHMIVI